jgi:catechol 2,3-dioxygenase-like lactoylglutathione lyase family enzyme
MAVDVFAGVAVSDYPRAVTWFERLLGTPATFEAHATECVWTLSDHGHIYVVLRPEYAGHAMVTVFPEDLDGFVQAAAGRGVHPDAQETYGNGVRKATFRDPDGNELGFGGAPLEAQEPNEPGVE